MKLKLILTDIGDLIDGAKDGTFDKQAAIDRAAEKVQEAHAAIKADYRKAFAAGFGAGVVFAVVAYGILRFV